MPDALMSLLTGGVLGLGWWAMLAVLLVFTQITIFSVTLYLHRSQAHRGVDFHPALAHLFRFWLWLTTSMITREWWPSTASTTPRWRPRTTRTARLPAASARCSGMAWSCIGKRVACARTLSSTGGGDAIERHLALRTPRWARCCCWQSTACCSACPAWPCGRSRWHGSRSGRPAWSTAWATGGATATTSLPIPPPISRRGVLDRWRGAAQQPPCLPQLGALRDAALGIRHRLECDPPAAGAAPGQVLRVAPAMDVRPNIAVPDAETLKALLSHRFQAMTDYQRNVFMPALREEAAQAGPNCVACCRAGCAAVWSTMAAG